MIQETTKTPNEKWYSSLGSLNYWSNGPDTVISINKAINSSSSKSSEEVLEAVFKILLEAEKGGYSRNGLTSTYYRNLLKVYYSDIYHDSDPQIAAVAAINYLKSFKQAYYEDTQTNGPVAVL